MPTLLRLKVRSHTRLSLLCPGDSDAVYDEDDDEEGRFFGGGLNEEQNVRLQ